MGRAQAHPPGAAHRGHQAEAHRARDAGLRRARVSAAANSTRRALHHGESGDYWKMTYSRMAFSRRPCMLPELPAKCRHTGALAGSRRARAQAACSSTGVALVRALSVAPFPDDGLEEGGPEREQAACRAAAAARDPARGLEYAAVPFAQSCVRPCSDMLTKRKLWRHNERVGYEGSSKGGGFGKSEHSRTCNDRQQYGWRRRLQQHVRYLQLPPGHDQLGGSESDGEGGDGGGGVEDGREGVGKRGGALGAVARPNAQPASSWAGRLRAGLGGCA